MEYLSGPALTLVTLHSQGFPIWDMNDSQGVPSKLALTHTSDIDCLERHSESTHFAQRRGGGDCVVSKVETVQRDTHRVMSTCPPLPTTSLSGAPVKGSGGAVTREMAERSSRKQGNLDVSQWISPPAVEICCKRTSTVYNLQISLSGF